MRGTKGRQRAVKQRQRVISKGEAKRTLLRRTLAENRSPSSRVRNNTRMTLSFAEVPPSAVRSAKQKQRSPRGFSAAVASPQASFTFFLTPVLILPSFLPLSSMFFARNSLHNVACAFKTC
jgi:hypothetical protein